MSRRRRIELRELFPSDLAGAAQLQEELAANVVDEDDFGDLRVVAGADVSYDATSGTLFAAVVSFDARTLDPLEVGAFEGVTRLPYVPGFLSFREGPAVLAALACLSRLPDLLLCDGHGRAHPRRFGLACHLGVALGVPTIGVGKSLLVGQHRTPGRLRGASTRLAHRGDVVGIALRTRTGVKPVYVSTGHRVSLPTARRLARIMHEGPRVGGGGLADVE